MDERLQRHRRHGGVMLEDRMQADDGHAMTAQPFMQRLRLRQSVQHATRAQHLEGMQDHDPASQASQGQRLRGVEPPVHLEFGRQRRVIHRHRRLGQASAVQLSSRCCGVQISLSVSKPFFRARWTMSCLRASGKCLSRASIHR